MNKVTEVRASEETYALGVEYGKKACPGQVYALTGDLGVGKTVFIRGFAEGLGVTDDVVSPTFTIVQEYRTGRFPMFHFDVYRIEDADELYEVGMEEYLYGDGVTLIEWAERFPEFVPENAVKITIEKDFAKGADYRRITVEGGARQ